MEREHDIIPVPESDEVIHHPHWDMLLDVCRELFTDLPEGEIDYIAGGAPTEGKTHECDVDDEIQVQIDSYEEAMDYATTIAIRLGVEDEFFAKLAEMGLL